MSKTVIRSKDQISSNDAISYDEAISMASNAWTDSAIYEAASHSRDVHKGNIVTFSKKVFINVVNLCRDTCGYCTYKAEQGQKETSMMDKKQVRVMLKAARQCGCVEALLVSGERPEEKYDSARKWLESQGCSSTPEYMEKCSQIALQEGLFPHTNAGSLEKEEMRNLQETNPSIGVMLENISPRLGDANMPHEYAPSKEPKKRLTVLKDAGELCFPITTGILVGIGETDQEVVSSIYEIRKMHEKYGNIQEIIMQNFIPKQDTIMRDKPAADNDRFKKLVAIARLAMPNMNIQVPPNLSPSSYESLLDAGINDWGGISPLTPDFVNPEMPWPTIHQVKEFTERVGFELKCRFPVYPEFMDMVPQNLRDAMSKVATKDGTVMEDRWV